MSTPNGAEQSDRSEVPRVEEHHTLDTAAAAVAAADPQQFYRDGQHFENTAQRLRTANDAFRRELRRVEGAWQGPGAQQFQTTARRITDTVEQLVETISAPSYSALHGHLGDAASNAGRQLRELRSQRESGRQAVADDPAMAGTPEGQQQLRHQEQAQNEHAQLVLRDLARIYQQVGGQLREAPPHSTRGTQVRDAVHRETGNEVDPGVAAGTDAITATGGAGFVGVNTPTSNSGTPGTGTGGTRSASSDTNDTLRHGVVVGGEESFSDSAQPTTHPTSSESASETFVKSTGAPTTLAGAARVGDGVLGRDTDRTTEITPDSGERVEASLASTEVPGVLAAPGMSVGATNPGGRERGGKERLEHRTELESASDLPETGNEAGTGAATFGTAVPVSRLEYSTPGTSTGYAAPTTQGEVASSRTSKPVSPGATAPSRVSTVVSPSSAYGASAAGMSTAGELGGTTAYSAANGRTATGGAAPTGTGRLANSAEIPSAVTTGNSGRTGPPASPERLGGAPGGSVPPTGGTGNRDDRERDRNTLRYEDEEVWGERGDSGGVLGR
ncbi:hypothetical protein SAMN04487820_105329 [Actinopolyspora mzabensis]|uniref:Proteins of 100 residues with WXG n=1 Tax=Actinopolyspora mzabensis TaxID=995066 RepID=A0A1G9A5N4_ACTMZ|nr:WXG100 family type VII secretion target [Actinopolyspora mzabensis]SDK22646.1 hypothetical protein SAMN04487820_105329 [Actinopolyspora mzabensis]